MSKKKIAMEPERMSRGEVFLRIIEKADGVQIPPLAEYADRFLAERDARNFDEEEL